MPLIGPNRYAVTVSPPDPQTQADIDNPWIQTTTGRTSVLSGRYTSAWTSVLSMRRR